MSGAPKDAKRPLERPFDGGVRPRVRHGWRPLLLRLLQPDRHAGPNRVVYFGYGVGDAQELGDLGWRGARRNLGSIRNIGCCQADARKLRASYNLDRLDR